MVREVRGLPPDLTDRPTRGSRTVLSLAGKQKSRGRGLRRGASSHSGRNRKEQEIPAGAESSVQPAAPIPQDVWAGPKGQPKMEQKKGRLCLSGFVFLTSAPRVAVPSTELSLPRGGSPRSRHLWERIGPRGPQSGGHLPLGGQDRWSSGGPSLGSVRGSFSCR